MILAKKKVSVITVAPSFSFSLAQEYSLLFFSREKLEISLLRHLPCGLRCNEGQVKTLLFSPPSSKSVPRESHVCFIFSYSIHSHFPNRQSRATHLTCIWDLFVNLRDFGAGCLVEWNV